MAVDWGRVEVLTAESSRTIMPVSEAKSFYYKLEFFKSVLCERNYRISRAAGAGEKKGKLSFFFKFMHAKCKFAP